MKCDTIELLNVLGKRWDATVLEEINRENGVNFDKLLAINRKIYPKTLNKALKDLIENRLVTKEIFYADKIKRSKYSITQKGRDLLQSFESFKNTNCTNRVSRVKPCGECGLGPNQASNNQQVT